MRGISVLQTLDLILRGPVRWSVCVSEITIKALVTSLHLLYNSCEHIMSNPTAKIISNGERTFLGAYAILIGDR